MSELTLPVMMPRDYQLPFWKAADSGKLRFFLRWARRAGKDLTGLNFTATRAAMKCGNYFHVLPYYAQVRKAIWEGKDKNGRPFLDAFPKDLIANRNEQEMKITLVNGSIWRCVGADNVDSLLSSNPCGLWFSEYPLMRDGVWDIMRPILAENGGWAAFVGTPRGKNHAWKLEQTAESDPENWFVSVVRASAYLPPEVLERERKEIIEKNGDDSLYQQEYEVSYTASVAGNYFSAQMLEMEKSGRLGNVPHDPTIPVHTVWDLGISDSTAIGFWQAVGAERRLIEAVEFQNKGMTDIIADLRTRPYMYGRHFAPHDIQVREYVSGKSRLDAAKGMGWDFEVVPQLPLKDGIDAMRNFLRFVIADKIKSAKAIEYWSLYHREWDDDSHCFKDRPEHDFSSHMADMGRYSAIVSDLMTPVQSSGRPLPKVQNFNYSSRLTKLCR